MVSEILGFVLNKRGGAWTQGVPGWCNWMCLSRWGSEGFLSY